MNRAEQMDEERGFVLPVKIVDGPRSTWIEDANGTVIVTISNMSANQSRELASALVDGIHAAYEDSDNDGA